MTPSTQDARATGLVEENAMLRAALRRCSEIVERNLYRQSEKVEDVKHVVAAALAASTKDMNHDG